MSKWSNSLVVQWLGIGTLTAGAQVRSLVKELKSYIPLGEAKKQTNNNNNKKTQTDEWINTTWYTWNTTEYYSAIKKKKKEWIWKTLQEEIEKLQREKAMHYKIPFIWNIQNRQIHKDNRLLSCHLRTKWVKGFLFG